MEQRKTKNTQFTACVDCFLTANKPQGENKNTELIMFASTLNT
uniref:Uncharacterized protein n=1 Tax=Anguilla anguilla TaxID=7936 RepID=A0A0E9SWX7_ANGAN